MFNVTDKRRAELQTIFLYKPLRAEQLRAINDLRVLFEHYLDLFKAGGPASESLKPVRAHLPAVANEGMNRLFETTQGYAHKLALELEKVLPPGRHKDLALTTLEEAKGYFNALLALDCGRMTPVGFSEDDGAFGFQRALVQTQMWANAAIAQDWPEEVAETSTPQ